MWLRPVLALFCVAAASACAPYEYYDVGALANVTAKFGAPYTILAKPAPSLSVDGTLLQFTARFGKCLQVAPQFSISAPEPHALGMIFVAVRSELGMPGLGCSPGEWTGRVTVQLPLTDGVPRLLAFPPGSEYELWKIDSEPVPALRLLRLYVHRAQPKIENPNGPCSAMLTVAPGTAMAELLALATQILGVQVVALRAEEDHSRELQNLADRASLVAFEAQTLPPPVKAQQPLHAPPAESTPWNLQSGEQNCSVGNVSTPYILAQL